MLGKHLKAILMATAMAVTTAPANAVVIKPATDAEIDKALASVPHIAFKRLDGGRVSNIPPKEHKVTPHFQELKKVSDKAGPNSANYVLRRRHWQPGSEGYQNISVAGPYGTQYAIEVTFGSLPLLLILDTGSSDTWSVNASFECVDYLLNEMDRESCGFGPGYPDEFDEGLEYEQHLYIEYGDGEIVTGPMGKLDLTVAGLTVDKQQVALANMTYWVGNNITSGIIGLAYQSLTASYFGDPLEHSTYDSSSYPPVFTNMVAQGLVEASFAIAINRNSSGGMIGWGGLPPVEGLDYTAVAYTPIIIANLIESEQTAYSYSFYTIIPDGVVFGQTTDTRKFPYIVDSGTTLNYLPPPLAEAINNAFDPPATYMWMYGAYFTTCDAIAPRMAFVINGAEFFLNPVDMIYRSLQDPLTGYCMTTVTSGGSGPFILGDAFLQNVLTVFDVGDSQLRFISRRFYH